MKKIILIACVALLAVGCKHDTFTISGTIENGAGKTLWLEEIAPEGPLFIDSIPVDSKGHFKYTYKMPYRSDGGKMLNELVDTSEYYAMLHERGLADDNTVAAKKQETDSIYRTIFSEQQEYVCRFIEENRGSLSTLIALYKPFNNRLLIDTRNPQSIEWYDMVLEGLQERYPDNPHTLHFKNTTEHLRSALSREQ